MKKIFVSSLPYSVDDAELEAMFAPYGTVLSAKVILDRDNNNRSKGYGFVEMEDDAAAQKAIDELNGSDCNGRSLIVNEARPREDKPRGGNGGGYGGGGNRW
jgi:RNA recognition motif-containing protein